MAITYVNDLRLSEMGTGDNSGTWGTVTNTNLELIGDAMGYGTRAIANASTDNITIADGTADADRAMYLKLTGGGQACTVTLLPNTVSKVWMMENGTNSALTFTQGSGANVTIPAGDTKIIASDGAGSGAIVYDVFASLSVVDLKVQDDLTVTDDMTVGGTLGVTGVLTATAGFVANDGSTITTADNTAQITLVSTSTNASQGPVLDLFRNSSSPADNDLGGAIKFNAENDAGEKTQYQIIQAYMPDVSNGSEDGAFQHYVMKDGTSIQRLEHSPTETVFNQDSADVDFRVESNGNTHMLFVDAGNDHVNIGTDTDLGGVFNVSGATASKFFSTDRHVMSLVSTEAGASDGPRLVIQRDSSSPADGDQLGILEFYGENDADEATEYARINASIVDASDGTEDGALGINTRIAGANVNRIYLPPTETVFNENSADLDFRVESNGNANMLFVNGEFNAVGIGNPTYDATHQLHILASSAVPNASLLIQSDATANATSQIQIFARTGSNENKITSLLNSAGSLVFGTNDGTSRMQLTSGGVLEVGEIQEQTQGTDISVTMVSEDAGLALTSRSATDAHSGYLSFVKTPATSGNYTATASGDRLGVINFVGVNTSAGADNGAQILVEQTGTASGTVPAKMSFFTNEAEKMQINSVGQVFVGEYTWLDAGTKAGLQVAGAGGGPYVIVCKNDDTSGGANQIKFLDGGNDICGTIASNATNNTTAYGTSSDYRLKENVTDVSNAISTFKTLKPKTYNFISDPDDTPENGFLAHELATVVPNAVIGEKDAVTSDGAIEPQQVDYGKLTPILTAALQEAIAKIETLETKVAALEA